MENALKSHVTVLSLFLLSHRVIYVTLGKQEIILEEQRILQCVREN